MCAILKPCGMAKGLHRANAVTGKRRSLRKIAAELAAVGHLNSAPSTVAATYLGHSTPA
jgi:hypothetical protein